MGKTIDARWNYRDVHDILAFYRQAAEQVAAGRGIRLSWTTHYTPAQWTSEFRRALDVRINLKAGSLPSWRKLDDQWQTECRRDQRALHDYLQRRVVRSGSGFALSEIRRRFPVVQAAFTSREGW